MFNIYAFITVQKLKMFIFISESFAYVSLLVGRLKENHRDTSA